MAEILLTKRDKILKKLYSKIEKQKKINKELRMRTSLRHRIMFKVNWKDYLKIKRLCVKDNTTTSELIRNIVERGLKKI